MPGKKPITPKPTTYRKITFRSVLEARTAVMLDNTPNVMNWQYEPQTFGLSEKGWEYTPDFEVDLYLQSNRSKLYIEVKPNEISPQYETVLKEFSSIMRWPLLIFIVDFYKQRFQSMVVLDRKIGHVRLCDYLSKFHEAFQRAAHFRFDLRQV